MKKRTHGRDNRDNRDNRQRQLVRQDWDFAPMLNWPEDALQKAWTWELEREWESGNLPYLLEWERLEQPRPQKHPPMLKSYWFYELAEDLKQRPGAPWIPSGTNDFTTIQPIEIDWTKNETEQLEAFRNWLRNDKGVHPFHTSYQTHENFLAGPKRGKRKTAGLLARLRDLAIHRIGAAGFTRKEGLVKLGIKQMSAPHWEHAQARTWERIVRHQQDLECLARNMSRIDPKHSSLNWRDYFMSQAVAFSLKVTPGN